ARPEDTLKIIAGWADNTWDVGREFGTIAFKKGTYTLEVTTYRADAYDKDSRKPVVAFGDNLRDDLFRRDFTMNAMALRLPQLELIDPFDGVASLNEGLIRTPGSPEVSFSDDPLRMMRAARFTSQLRMNVAPEVRKAMRHMADRLEIISAERIRDELVKLINGADPRSGI